MLLTTDTVGGVWTYSLALAAGFFALGCAVTLATMGPPPSRSQAAAVERVPGVRLLTTDLPLDWTARDETELEGAAKKLNAIAEEIGADHVHLHTPALAAFTWSVAPVAVAHSCVGTWWEAAGEGDPPADFAWRMRLMRAGILCAAAVIAPTASFAASLRRVYGFAGPIRVVHNGFSAPPMPTFPNVAARQRRVLCAGRLWDRAKNFSLLDEAAAWLGAPIDAAGPVSHADHGELRPRHLTLLGNLAPEALHHHYASASIFAAPSLYEPFGLAVLEAAQRAMPLVLADIPTFRELWQGAAVFLPPDNPRAWAATLAALLDSPERRDLLGARAQNQARLYDLERMIEGTAAAHARPAALAGA